MPAHHSFDAENARAVKRARLQVPETRFVCADGRRPVCWRYFTYYWQAAKSSIAQVEERDLKQQLKNREKQQETKRPLAETTVLSPAVPVKSTECQQQKQKQQQQQEEKQKQQQQEKQQRQQQSHQGDFAVKRVRADLFPASSDGAGSSSRVPVAMQPTAGNGALSKMQQGEITFLCMRIM